MPEDLTKSGEIHIKGAREHNLKDVEIRIPRNKLVVITGVSGSGKSSLAFDTVYAEGYRKFMDSLSIRARQLLESIQKPDVDFIHGLTPVLAIEQRTGSGAGPRSTVATASEIADFARLLWVHVGEQFCPIDGGRIERRSLDDCVTRIMQEPEGSRLILLAPYMKTKPAVLREELPRLKQRGFSRVRIDGDIRELDDPDLIDSKAKEIAVDIVIDRLVVREDQRSRIADSLELAFKEGEDKAIVLSQVSRDAEWSEFTVSQSLASVIGGTVYDPLTPRHLSANHPEGACETCAGLGQVRQFVPELMVPDPSLSVRKGAIKPLRLGGKSTLIRRNALLKQLAEQLPFDPTTPWEDLDEETKRIILYGAGDRLFSFKLKRGNSKPKPAPYEGAIAELEQTLKDTSSDGLRARLAPYQIPQPCPSCDGTGFSKRARNVLLDGVSIDRFFRWSVAEAYEFIHGLVEDKRFSQFREAITGIDRQLYYLKELGLDYLTLNRAYKTLSGGESQRVRLATQLGVSLVGVTYVLDEPSIGLHAADNDRLISALKDLRDMGNSVIVVEHDEDMMKAADHLIEMGPDAGERGGKVIFEGTPESAIAEGRSRTGMYLAGNLKIERDAKLKKAHNSWLQIRGARENNLQSVDVDMPVGLLTVVCGVSGSGKSTLINRVLADAAVRKLNGAKGIPGAHDRIDGFDHFGGCIRIDQSPIGRSPRSNPATYVKLFDPLRQLFAKCSLAKIRGYGANRFSFNVRGGRCERCQGDGQIKLDMQFMGDVFVECPSCRGQRYNRETLEVRFKGHNIADVLSMTIDEARGLFRNQPAIATKLDTLSAVGLGYLRLGQSATTLSGGEAQRIKLSLELSKRKQGDVLYVLDEPTTGLHADDIQKLMDVLFKLRDAGNTLVLIEHHQDVIRLADWVVELGPGGGKKGGQLVYSGPLANMRGQEESPTAKYLF